MRSGTSFFPKAAYSLSILAEPAGKCNEKTMFSRVFYPMDGKRDGAFATVTKITSGAYAG
jgi:hypothetical protein